MRPPGRAAGASGGRRARVRRFATALAGVGVLGSALTGCTATKDPRPDCAALEQFGSLDGKKVTVLAPEASQAFTDSLADFSACTKARVEVTAAPRNTDLADYLSARVSGHNPPDVAVVSHSVMRGFATSGTALVKSPATVVTALAKDYPAGWRDSMSINGAVYGVPTSVQVKSLVWYSPAMFAKKGYAIPATWSELTALTDRIAKDDANRAGTKPWCAGFAKGADSGWPGTDWIEDAVLRFAGTSVYDAWVDHRIAFDDPRIVAAVRRVSAIVKNPDNVNGGLGSPAGIAQTYYDEGGLPILDGTCYLHRQGAFLAPNWRGATIGRSGDVWAFYLPAVEGAPPKPVLGTGDVAVMMANRPEVAAFQTFLTTSGWVNARARAATEEARTQRWISWVSPHKGLDESLLPSDIDRLSAQVLRADGAVFRYDASDDMPKAVGSKAFWTSVNNWITGSASDAEMLAFVERVWRQQP